VIYQINEETIDHL